MPTPTSNPKPPYRRWRLYVAGTHHDHTSQRKTYTHAQQLLTDGTPITVYHWEDGRWRLHERLRPEDL